MESASLVIVCLLLASCPATAQTGVPVSKSDATATVNFSKLMNKASRDVTAAFKAPLLAETARRPMKTVASPPPYPTTVDVPHSTDTANTLASLKGVGDPPDINGSVGPDHLFLALNYRLHAQKRDGTPIGTVYPKDFWAAILDADVYPFDPRLHFDHFAGKWIMSYCAKAGNLTKAAILIGISLTSDPTGDWTLFKVVIDPKNQHWIDYGRLGFNEKRLVVSGWVSSLPGMAVEYKYVYFVFDKADLAPGKPGGYTLFSLDPPYSGIPTVTHDKGVSAVSVVQMAEIYQDICVFEIAEVSGSLTFRTKMTVSPKWNWNVQMEKAPQKGTMVQLDALDLEGHALLRNGQLWLVHSVCPTATPNARASVQWWQIDSTKGTVIQQGELDDPNAKFSYIHPSIAVNGNNDVLIGYTRCSADTYPTAAFAYRRGKDKPEQLVGDYVFKAGEIAYGDPAASGTVRWADYSSSCIDPVDDSLWTLQQYAAKGEASGYTNGLFWKQLQKGK